MKKKKTRNKIYTHTFLLKTPLIILRALAVEARVCPSEGETLRFDWPTVRSIIMCVMDLSRQWPDRLLGTMAELLRQWSSLV